MEWLGEVPIRRTRHAKLPVDLDVGLRDFGHAEARKRVAYDRLGDGAQRAAQRLDLVLHDRLLVVSQLQLPQRRLEAINTRRAARRAARGERAEAGRRAEGGPCDGSVAARAPPSPVPLATPYSGASYCALSRRSAPPGRTGG